MSGIYQIRPEKGGEISHLADNGHRREEACFSMDCRPFDHALLDFLCGQRHSHQAEISADVDSGGDVLRSFPVRMEQAARRPVPYASENLPPAAFYCYGGRWLRGQETKDYLLTPELVAALLNELNQDKWIALLTDFIQANFVAKGLGTDVCIHNTDGHNHHAHIMLTVQPLTKDGSWQHKTEREYLRVRNGEEQALRRWTSKQYRARAGRNSISIGLERKRSICRPQRLKHRGWNEYPNIRKAPSTGGRIPSPLAGTARSSLSSGGRHGPTQ